MTASSHPLFVYGTAWKEVRTAELTLNALRSGFRAIDSANQRRHYYETGVGQALEVAYRDGIVQREDLFLQTKFTYKEGQDNRLPYNPSAPFGTQVAQSVTSSLQHLGTDYVDSLLLHGPASSTVWTLADTETWHAMCRERDMGRVRYLGISNVSIGHLEQMPEIPAIVQNRCFASMGWDREVREFCHEHGILYQGFSLLTANVEVLRHPLVQEISELSQATIPQVMFAFARQIGILPLTGTTDAVHMEEDLASLSLELPLDAVQAIESLADWQQEKALYMGLGT